MYLSWTFSKVAPTGGAMVALASGAAEDQASLQITHVHTPQTQPTLQSPRLRFPKWLVANKPM
jgi:hypothetical protein